MISHSISTRTKLNHKYQTLPPDHADKRVLLLASVGDELFIQIRIRGKGGTIQNWRASQNTSMGKQCGQLEKPVILPLVARICVPLLTLTCQILGHVASQANDHLLTEDRLYLSSSKNGSVQIFIKPFV